MFTLLYLSCKLMWKLTWAMLVLCYYATIFGAALCWVMLWAIVALFTLGRSTRVWKLKERRVKGFPLWL